MGARDIWVWHCNGLYYMHYGGADFNGWPASLATSKNATFWQKFGRALSFGERGSKDAGSASCGVTFFDNQVWHMFYLGMPNASPLPDLVPCFHISQ